MADRLPVALSHPLRRRLLFEYTLAVTSPSQVAHRLSEPVNRVAYHTGILLRDGFVELVRTERRRGALSRFYHAAVPAFLEDEDWRTLPGTTRRVLALGALEHVYEDVRRAALAGGFDGPQVQLTRSPLLLDEDGADALAALLRTAFAELEAIVADATARDAADRAAYEVVMLAYERTPKAL
ncbi:helix-turn-helix protein [Solirubrobacter pauli]|uniref:Helix-turn-helix protein n=1 Tax=Solirubrobacter pauli TaxID=166793 RepID=A0A660KX04_9ACTN|nr:helix-turn-helix transcriptional regulator [Solirubrobacter pauli]RKQ84982.1 helix-turn-helix protein [Solirubrobacter pauli]